MTANGRYGRVVDTCGERTGTTMPSPGGRPDDGPEPRPDVHPDMRHDEREEAVVAWFCSDRGFGQLETGDGELVYVCQRDILCDGFRSVDEGQRVTFVPGSDLHGLVARRVVVDEVGRRDQGMLAS